MQTQLSSQALPEPRFSEGVVRTLGRLAGWSININVPIPKKCVVVGAHHTSGTDFFAAMFLFAGAGIKMRWVTKDDFFKPPFSPLLYAMGGMPVNRNARTNFVGQMVEQFRQHDVLRLGIMPEGTRRKASHWKTGFYYIALGAQVPILFGYADYPTKEVGIGGVLLPSGDIAADFVVIRRFYERVQARYPHRVSDITLRQDRR